MHASYNDRSWTDSLMWLHPSNHHSSRVKFLLFGAISIFLFTTFRALGAHDYLPTSVFHSSEYTTTTGDGISTLNILEFPCYILTADKSDEAGLKQSNELRKRLLGVGFNEVYLVEGVNKPDHKPYAVAMGHALIVKQALRYNALTSPHKFRPFIIFENDINFLDGFDPVISFPSDADALYVSIENLGSIMSGSETFAHWQKGAFWSRHPKLPNIARIYNMLTTHGTLVLTPRFAENWLLSAFEGATREVHFDTIVALTMRYYNVYAQRAPIFWQASKEDHERWQLEGQEIHGVQDIPLHEKRPHSIAFELADFETSGAKDVPYDEERNQFAGYHRHHKTDEALVNRVPYNEKYRHLINGGVPKFGGDDNVSAEDKKKSQELYKSESREAAEKAKEKGKEK